ncbi:hypothetical protein PG985_008502 [Apiospora marii]|uniref:Uncharacterized protein n=1 Tax=Apiospora marii TaxID=335849 RepID=A0ABR1SS55_9PEZI
MSSEIPALSAAQWEQIQTFWLRSGETNLWCLIQSHLMNSAMLLGGEALSSYFPRWWEDKEFVKRIEITRNAVTLVVIPGSRFRHTFALLGVRPTDTRATVAIATSWDFTSEQRTALENKVAEVLDDEEISSRIKFAYGSCHPPGQ